MKKTIFWGPLRTGMQVILFLAISIFSVGAGSPNVAHAKSSSDPAAENNTACGQLLTDAEAAFVATLAPDGSVPANPETQAAAQEYIRVSELCYKQTQAENAPNALQGETPTFIDEGGLVPGHATFAEYATWGTKWGSSTQGTSGGTVTYSFMGDGISFESEGRDYGTSTAISHLPNFQACFITEIEQAFAAWQAVSNIKFVQATDNGAAFDAPGAVGDIRIGAHPFDGRWGILAHAYFPPPAGYAYSDAGDMHFDSAESWTCNTSGTDIGIVALHEIGHSLGLDHEATAAVTVMDPYYNPNLTGLQPDDRSGIAAIYGPAQLSAAAPANDDIASATFFNSVPYTNSINATGATTAAGDAPTIGPCGTATGDKTLRQGNQTVWYRYTPSVTKMISLDTNGSSYDTYIAVWTGTIGALSLVKCNEDTFEGIEGKLSFTGTAGSTYYIEVGSFSGYVGQPRLGDSPTASLEFHATTFEDVRGDYWAWRFVEGLYKAGVTSGCSSSPMRYCPGTTVTRDQMAVFLLKAKHGSNYFPPAATGVFQDVPTSHWAASWIERLAAEGITGGCSTTPKLYCPSTPVTRDQMAIFLLKAKHGSSYSPPAATGVFQDVPTNHWAAAWIERLAAEGITGGCSTSPMLYCPSTPVTRDQMAVFLDRAFNIPILPSP